MGYLALLILGFQFIFGLYSISIDPKCSAAEKTASTVFVLCFSCATGLVYAAYLGYVNENQWLIVWAWLCLVTVPFTVIASLYQAFKGDSLAVFVSRILLIVPGTLVMARFVGLL